MKMTKTIKKVKISSIYTIFGKMWQQVAGVIIIWLLVNKLSVGEFGIYNLLLGTSAFLSIVTSFGIIPAVERYLPEFFQKGEIGKYSWTIKLVFTFRICAAIISISVILIFFDWIGPFFSLQAELFQRSLEAMFLHQYAVYAFSVYLFLRLIFLFVFLYLGYGLFQVLLIDLFTHFVLFALYYYCHTINYYEKYKRFFSIQGKKQKPPDHKVGA